MARLILSAIVGAFIIGAGLSPASARNCGTCSKDYENTQCCSSRVIHICTCSGSSCSWKSAMTKCEDN
jgi:hypothetical protein